MSKIIAHDINEKVRSADVLTQNDCTFDFLLLSKPVLQALNEAGFYKPSPIQLKAIPPGKCGLDLILQSKSGTGKTLIFAIIALEMIQTAIDHPQVLIIAPTREIADQICSVITAIGRHIPDLSVGLFIGGLPYKEDVQRLKKCHIAVGAPGRIKHLIEAKELNVNFVKLFVLDEADKLMEEDFQNAINYCYHMLPERKQFLATSATVPAELKTFLERYMNSPTFISLEVNSPLLLGLRQFVSVLPNRSNVVQQTNAKTDDVCRILSKVSFTQCIIFCNYQQRAETVSNIINQRGWKSIFIGGSQSQETRLKVMHMLKNLECNILLATNLIARGIDLSNVDLVINYDIPSDTATYLHRVGRTGRYGSVGVCVSLVACDKDLLDLQYILGDIGGVELGIAKLPIELDQAVWEEELSSFEQIYGLVDPQREKVDWNFLESTTKLHKGRKKKKKTSISQPAVEVESAKEADFDGVSTDDLLKSLAKGLRIEPPATLPSVDKPADTEPVPEQSTKKAKHNEHLPQATFPNHPIEDPYVGISTADLLQQFAQGKKIEPTVATEELVNPASLYPWVPVEESVLSKNANGLNLLDSDNSVCSDQEVDISNEMLNKKVTLTKNLALYHTANLIKKCENLDFSVTKEAVQSIRDYFNVCEEKTSDRLSKLDAATKDVPTENLLEQMSYYSNKFKADSLEDVPTENICKVAYEHILGGTKDWRNLVDDSYKKKKEPSPPVETEIDLVNATAPYDSDHQCNTIAWYQDMYGHYYDYYENLLTENASTFEDVPSFRGWFHQWQSQLKSVTSYVQQHIYLQEMNNFQFNNYQNY
ncbi:hypothetical protein PPYR_10295 [Photinus pyralis]|uniref:RNA helicase n=2 Tax=Photinus pyralis TaxID=7054 RepID=A0A5N4AFZ9_PHOPY|nr:probable ATP-dependent RNA helicase DDX20 [Photinus pyralis]KAB0796234.1 hypothetical protein PPYR_10295 [Photinus pyralis]